MDLNINVVRKYFKEKYTIGNVFTNGQWFSNSLEDCDRGLQQGMSLSQLKKMKKYGATAIPYGTYDVSVYFWPKYRKKYPLLQNVPAYTGVLVHGGSTHKDTLGCILVGENRVKGQLTNCEKYVRKLTQMCEDAIQSGGKVILTICRE